MIYRPDAVCLRLNVSTAFCVADAGYAAARQVAMPRHRNCAAGFLRRSPMRRRQRRRHSPLRPKSAPGSEVCPSSRGPNGSSLRPGFRQHAAGRHRQHRAHRHHLYLPVTATSPKMPRQAGLDRRSARADDSGLHAQLFTAYRRPVDHPVLSSAAGAQAAAGYRPRGEGIPDADAPKRIELDEQRSSPLSSSSIGMIIDLCSAPLTCGRRSLPDLSG